VRGLADRRFTLRYVRPQLCGRRGVRKRALCMPAGDGSVRQRLHRSGVRSLPLRRVWRLMWRPERPKESHGMHRRQVRLRSRPIVRVSTMHSRRPDGLLLPSRRRVLRQAAARRAGHMLPKRLPRLLLRREQRDLRAVRSVDELRRERDSLQGRSLGVAARSLPVV